MSKTFALSSRHDAKECLRHIVENAERVARHAAGLDQGTFEQDEWALAACERYIERVCEAVIRLGDRAEDLMPGQPWRAIRGMGNRLRHAYDDIDPVIVWETIQTRLPQLADAARAALTRLASTENGSKQRN